MPLPSHLSESVSSAAQLSALIDEAQRIKYDVTGLSETKRKESLTCTWNNGAAVFLGARKPGTASGGAGFIVAPNFARSITSATFYGYRLAVLTVSLSKEIDVSLIQTYAPTADRDEEEHDKFHSDLGDLDHGRLEKYLSDRTRQSEETTGERLANFCETLHLFHENSQFVKNPAKRWIHVSSNGQHYHELDHILCNKRVITDVSVVPSFNTGGDDRLLRARPHFDRGQVRLLRIRSRRPRPTVMDEEMIETVAAKETFEMVDDVNEDYTRRVGTIIKIRNECRAETQNHASRRISSSTRALLEKRRHMDRQANHVEYAVLNRLCRQRLPEDHANFVRSRLLDAAHSKRSLKMGKRTEHRLSILCLKAPDGSRCSSRPEMENIMANFYTALYKSDSGQTAVLSPGEEVPPFVTSEVRHAIEIMPRGKAPAVDGITVELLQACVPTLYTALARHFSLCQAKCEVPAAWKQSSTILLFKKGDKEDLENYRPITLLPVLYKEPLVLTFIDYKKAFDSVEPAEVWKAPEEQGVEARYTKVLRKCYSGYTIVFRPFLNDIEVSVEKGVRQGDPASPNLFSACLESVIRNCDWSSFGVLIDEERLNRLRFADDIVLITRMPLKCFDGQMKKEAKQALPSTRPRPRLCEAHFLVGSHYFFKECLSKMSANMSISVACLTWRTTSSPRLRGEEEQAGPHIIQSKAYSKIPKTRSCAQISSTRPCRLPCVKR
ncbi:hypothetical protein Y032_0653g1181 [Ancylostoma ceylanicum]|uniref:Reverse transcriptase domain-containing protein n=1 Tax=Ancylostoma ceylanicum TaxID=53326 RepID=A0A016WIQ6_9BILA|nr:hypothetical protein Y032_0653g1181 [Ancylostoma ceylanicum]